MWTVRTLTLLFALSVITFGAASAETSIDNTTVASSGLDATLASSQDANLTDYNAAADPFAGLEAFRTSAPRPQSCSQYNELCADLEVGNGCSLTDPRCRCVSTIPAICALP